MISMSWTLHKPFASYYTQVPLIALNKYRQRRRSVSQPRPPVSKPSSVLNSEPLTASHNDDPHDDQRPRVVANELAYRIVTGPHDRLHDGTESLNVEQDRASVQHLTPVYKRSPARTFRSVGTACSRPTITSRNRSDTFICIEAALSTVSRPLLTSFRLSTRFHPH
jgi:hypothetical protein